ncbi:MAG: pirin family protein [Verrucomicrobiota bacterium]
MSTAATTIKIRRAADRFHSNHGWLDSNHTFSFAGHFDPDYAGFESLRVINDDRVAPMMGFGEHPHRDMEIISYVISGELRHQDSMGNGRTIQAGEFQYLSAGSGVVHSEFNPSSEQPVHFLQIWIIPDEKGASPRYAELRPEIGNDGLSLIALPDGREGSIAIRQQAELSFGKLSRGTSLQPESSRNRHWLHLISGQVSIDGESLEPGDGAAIDGPVPELTATEDAEFLLFSLAPFQA